MKIFPVEFPNFGLSASMVSSTQSINKKKTKRKREKVRGDRVWCVKCNIIRKKTERKRERGIRYNVEKEGGTRAYL